MDNYVKERNQELEIRCENLLQEWGVSPRYIGFSYMVECVLYGNSGNIVEACEEVAKRHGISKSGVYCAIDGALKRAEYDRKKVSAKHHIFTGKKLKAKNIYSSLKYYSADENY